MIVAARAGHRETQHAACDRIDTIIHGLRKAVGKLAPEAKKSERRQMPRLGFRYPIRRKLILEKLIVRKISLKARITQSRYV